MNYIFIFLLLILPLNADISSLCIDIEKKYYTTEPNIKDCYTTKFTEEEDKTQCIRNEYNHFNTDIDALSEKVHRQSKEIILDKKSIGVFCNPLISRINAIFTGDNDKKKELQKVFSESKKKYQQKLLHSLHLKKCDVPKECSSKLKLFLRNKRKGSSLLELTKERYYSCMARTRSFEPIINSPEQGQNDTASVVNSEEKNLPFGLSGVKKDSDIEKSINTNLTDMPNPIVVGAETISEDSHFYTLPEKQELPEINTPLESSIQPDNQLINNASELIYQENSIHPITQPDNQGDDFTEPVENPNTSQIKRDISNRYSLSKHEVKKKRFINYVEELIVTINTTVNLIEDVKMK